MTASAPVLEWFYFSFATDEDGFLGGVYIDGVDSMHAYMKMCADKLNPGGQVAMLGPLPAAEFQEHVPLSNRRRLLTRVELEAE